MFFLLQEERAALTDDLESQAVLGLWTEQCGGDSPEGKMTERMASHCAGVSMALWRKAAQGLDRQMVREGEVLRASEH